MTLTIPLLAGTLASMLHVISGPDHLAAVTPLVIETKRKAWKIGLFWGLGHLVGMLLIGVLFLLFKEYIPVESISKYSEQLVAIVLIGVGFSIVFLMSKKNINILMFIMKAKTMFIYMRMSIVIMRVINMCTIKL